MGLLGRERELKTNLDTGKMPERCGSSQIHRMDRSKGHMAECKLIKI